MSTATDHKHHQEITLLQERSAGTFARVYLAEAHSADGLSRIVAVKILKTQWSSDPELLNRTHDEARLLARLHHRNILRVESMADIAGQPAILMEFVDGLDIKQLIEHTSSPIPARAAYRVVRDTAAALEAAYFRAPYGREEPLRVIHRDIKPSNIMISIEGDVKVLDFGTARYQNEVRLAQTGALRFGSLKYMSPERRAGDRGEHSCDIYSLGILLLEMLLGELLPVLPLERPEHDEFVHEQIARIPTLGLPNDEWRASLVQTLSRMCAFHSAHRLDAQQVVQLMRAFSEQASGSSIDTFATTVVEPLSKSLFQHRTQGDYTGRRVSVQLTTSGSFQERYSQQNAETPSTETITDPLTHPPLTKKYAIPPLENGGPLEHGGNPSQPPPEDEYGDPTIIGPEGLVVSPITDESATTASQPPPKAAVAYANTPMNPSAAIEQPGGNRMLLIGVVAALVGVLLAVVGAGGFGWIYYYYLYQPPLSTADNVAPVDVPEIVEPTEPMDVEPQPAETNAAAETVFVTLAAEDEAIQWIKISSESEGTLLKGSPDGSESIPPGEYIVSVKVVARPKVQATLELTGNEVAIQCTPEENQRVLCTINDDTALTLTP